MAPHDFEHDHVREHSVSLLLRGGIALSGALLLVGFLLYAAQPVWYDVPDATAMWMELLGGHDLSLSNPFVFFYTGLLILILTPVARVAMTAWIFARERDLRYFVISLIVFFILVGSIVLSLLLT
jgi:uncharacterized membrane protein